MTLVELLVAMTTGLFLILTVSSVYITTASSSRVSVLSAQMNEDAALAIELLQEQIRLSGYSSQSASGARNFSGIPLRGCDGGFTSASDSQAFNTLTCIGGAGPDALAVRFEATNLNSQEVNKTSLGITLPANCSSAGIAPSVQGSGVSVSLADNRFYIAADAVNAGTPTLFCRGSDSAVGFSNATALIPNIEDLQFRYSITRMPVAGQVMPHQVTAHVDASAASLGNTELNWARVAAVHVCLVARSSQPIPPGDNQAADISRFIDCTNKEKNPGDGFLRRSYRTTVFLRNARPAVPSAFHLDGATPMSPYRHLSSAN